MGRLAIGAAATLVMLSGCVAEGVRSVNNEGVYSVSVHGPLGLTDPRSTRVRGAEAADEFCAESKRMAHITAYNSLVLQFTCVEGTAADYQP